MICIPIGAEDNAAMLALLRRASAEPADLHELRFDLMKEQPKVEELTAVSSRPVIATCRSLREGGGFAGSADERRDILRRAIRSGAAYIDAETADIPYLDNRENVTLIASLHDFETTPDDLEEKIADLAASGADWVKFAVAVRRTADNLKVLAAIASSPKPCIGIGMGERGLLSRILGPAYGSKVTFGSLETGRESAPGQPTARELAELYRVGNITTDTAVYGLLGDPVAQSRGYVLHNRAFARLGIDAVYISFLAESAEEFLEAVPGAVNLQGLSVTIPHKHAALAWADSASEAATRIGAANTLIDGPDGWRAENTDCLAIFETIKAAFAAAGVDPYGVRTLVLGAGGTARAAGVALMLLGCRVAVAARDMIKAGKLALDMGWEAVAWKEAWQGDWKVVANATPVGMTPNIDASPYPAHGWRKGMLAFDAVHNPAETRFLREAAAAGARPISGEDMFFRQAAGQFKLWTGKTLPAETDL